ncbi:MAG TPA: hypothetical protein VEC35_19335 [Noviherbaspirillum sp.]|nr:hypothetical protein [Noviherbaspirillum sp.]
MIHSSGLELQAMQDGDEAALPALNAADAETLLRFVAAAAHGLRRAAEAQIECINGNA